ncbi:DUF5946 family protein [Amnibacterium setariae]|uniref:Uncharacterized protein n=1 Tax=Amnibacterium setariae TaxID=2306585 RepID=A0A3A1TZE3_9MICO|nr:DUF5946 family protein [Amnibacterium setariae]RIX27596.1 hypothetical protein D1781_08480 [Amnibacterium setariae]
MRSRTACPGCGIVLPETAAGETPRLHSSAACEAVLHEVLGFEFQHPVMLRYHQLTVDAYGAQHAGGGAPAIRVAYSLAGLWLALEHGFSAEDVRAVHRRMGHPTAEWPVFEPPRTPRRWLTVLDVAEAGVRQHSDGGHARAAGQWAESVWTAWLEDSPGIDDAVEGMLRGIFLETGHHEGLHGTIGPAAAVHRLLGLLEA